MVRVAWLTLILVAVGLALTIAPPPASAQAAGEYPSVANLQPFTAASNYMSLPGYLRLQVWRDQQVWLTYAEARRIVRAQGGTVIT
jgi:hypothetical protein